MTWAAAIAISLASTASAPAASASTSDDARAALIAEIAATPGKSGGIYYAYPVTSDECPAPPQGYIPVAINHYGRHGSRWILKEWQYPMVLDTLKAQMQAGNLTPFGQDVMRRVAIMARHAEGHLGELSPIGERQHKGIALRMALRFPGLFAGDAAIDAHSSVEPRCIVSMAAFSEQLKEYNPALRITRHASPGDMAYIAYTSPEAKAFGSDSAAWQTGLRVFSDSVLDPARLMARMFHRPDAVGNRHLLMRTLHDLAVDMQDVELDVELLDIFTPDELFALWQALNYRMYVRHASAAVNGGIPPKSAASLLTDIITTSENMLHAVDAPRVTLRFGHDTNLIRLLALMQLEGCAEVESRPADYCTAWQDFRVSPMAANLQIIFFRNDRGDVIALVRHNERPARLPIPSVDSDGYFYDWDTLREFWLSQIS